MGEHFSSFNCILNVIEPNFCGLYIAKMKIVLIALLFGICQAKPQSLEFFEKTQETFGDEFQEKLWTILQESMKHFMENKLVKLMNTDGQYMITNLVYPVQLWTFIEMEKICTKISARKLIGKKK